MRVAKTRAQIQAEALKMKKLIEQRALGVSTAVRYPDDPVRFGMEVLGEHYTEDVKEVMRSVLNNPVTIAISANATGKTHCAARLAAWFYKVFEDSQVYTTSAPPVRNLEKILWGELGTLVRTHPSIFSTDAIAAGMNIQRHKQSFITGVAIPASGRASEREAKFSGKHAPHLLFIVDEGDAVPPEVYSGIESCMSGGFARLLIMFNPRSETGSVANMIKKKQGNVVHLSAFNHPNVVTGEDVIPGAVSREKTVRRINEWTRPLVPGERPSNECFEVPSFLVGAVAASLDGRTTYPPLPAGVRKVTVPAFFYMVIGQYPPQGAAQLISRMWVEAAQTRYLAYVARYGDIPPANVTPIIGLDVADMGEDFNVKTVRYGGYVSPQRAWNGIDPDATALRVGEEVKSLGFVNATIPVFVDATGVGAGVAPRLRRLGFSRADGIMVASSPTYDVKELGVFKQMRDQLWWTMAMWLRDDAGAMLPPDEDLAQELCTPSYEVDGGTIRVDSKKTMKELLGRSPDRAESLMMTFAPRQYVAGAW